VYFAWRFTVEDVQLEGVASHAMPHGGHSEIDHWMGKVACCGGRNLS
jgi:hypothetical protein